MITITYDFKNRRAEDIAQINAILATMKLRDLRLEEHEGYLATTTDADGNLLHQRCGLDRGKLICEPAEGESGYVYQIDTAVADRSEDHEEFLRIWRNRNPHRAMRIVIKVEYGNAFAYTIVHHQKVDAGTEGRGWIRNVGLRR